MKIVIFTLTGQRDKVVDELLAKHLRKYGHEVWVHTYLGAGRQSVPYLKPDVVIVPMVGGQFKLDFVQQCKEWGCTVVVRRGEAGASREVFETMEPDRQDITLGHWDYSPCVDLELTWGQEFTDLLAEKGCMPREKLRACGAFSFDAYFLPETKRDENHEKTVLFATSWSGADGRPEHIECGLPEDSEYQTVLYDRHKEGRNIWIKTIKELIRWFSNDWRFTLKVRPGERIDEYVIEFGDSVEIYPQICPAIDALKETDILVHSGSTMAIEAHLLNIPSFNFHNINPDGLLASVCPRLETYRELEWNLARANIYQSNINESVYNELQKHLYGPIDGKACERAAKYIDEHIIDAHKKGKKIEPDIPNVWPKIVKYEDDIEIIRFGEKKEEGDHQWVCPACLERCYTANNITTLKCPYCGMVIERTNVERRRKGILA